VPDSSQVFQHSATEALTHNPVQNNTIKQSIYTSIHKYVVTSNN